MTSHNVIYDYIADKFRNDEREEITLDELLLDAEFEGFGDIWEIPKQGMANAFSARGLVLADGKLSFPVNEEGPFDPIENNYGDFINKAVEVLKAAEHPLDMATLASMVDMHKATVPYGSMQTLLAPHGFHFLPGLGYWRHPQFKNPDGSIVSKRYKSERKNALMEAFEKYGWPISAKDVEKQTGGLANGRYIQRETQVGNPIVKSIGSGLYVPVSEMEGQKIPMSINVVREVLSLQDGSLIVDKPTTRMFKLMLVLHRAGWVTSKKSRSTFDGERCQSQRVTLTELGKKELQKMLPVKASDDF
jgi:hypothetical protein